MLSIARPAVLAAALIAGLVCQSAAAPIPSTTDWGPLASGSFTDAFSHSNLAASFVDDYTFSLSQAVDFSAALDNAFSTSDQAIPNLKLSLYAGASMPGSLVDSATAAVPAGLKVNMASFDDVIGPGSYYLQVSGDPTVLSAYSGTIALSISAVPLPAGLPLFGGALLIVAAAGLNRRRKQASGASLESL